jgi:ankyrin repeat protein
MNFLRQAFLQVFLLASLSMSAHSDTWEEGDGKYFEEGDVAAVKKILSKKPYSGDLLIQAFETAVQSGNIDLIKLLDNRGWVKICRSDKSCDPVAYAVISKKHPKMVDYLLSRGFTPTSSALYSSSAQVIPEDETVSRSMEVVKLLCEHGANPATKSQNKVGLSVQLDPSVLEELETRIAEPHMDLGSPLREARGTAAEIQITEFFKKGACKKGAASTTYFDDYLTIVRVMRKGTVNAKFPAMLDTKYLRPQVKTYLLYEAIASGSLDLLAKLKSRGWMSHCRENATCRPFDIAAEIGADKKIFQFLVSEGFKLDDSRNTSGGTPLMYATLNARVDAVKLLCEHGADYRKRVKLEIYDRSIISILRRSYSSAWCSSVIFGEHSKAIQEAARSRCEGEGGVLFGPQSHVSIPECIPGATCMSVPFPPKGQKDVGELTALAEIFQYFKNGLCKPAKNAPTPACTSDVEAGAVIIGDNVLLRAEPSVSGAKINTLSFGTVVDVLDSSRTCESLLSRTGRWIKIKVKQYLNVERQQAEGWVFDMYVDYFPPFEP